MYHMYSHVYELHSHVLLSFPPTLSPYLLSLSILQLFEGWIKDIQRDVVPLDRIKLCICGHAQVGKSAMRESLSKPYLQVGG